MKDIHVFLNFMSTTYKVCQAKIIYVIGLIFLNVMQYLCAILIAYYTEILVNEVFVKQNIGYLFCTIPYAVLVVVLIAALNIIIEYLVALWKVRLDFSAKLSFFNKIVFVDNEHLKNITNGELFHRMFSDSSSISKHLHIYLVDTPLNLIFCSMLCVMMFNWSWQLSCFTIILVVIDGLSIVLLKKPIEKINVKQFDVDQSVSKLLLEFLSKLQYLQITGIRNWCSTKVLIKFKEAAKITISNCFTSSLFAAIISMLQQFWTFGFLILSCLLIYKGDITIGTFVGFQLLSGYFLSAFSKLASNVISFQTAKVSYNRYFEYYDLPVLQEGNLTCIFNFSLAFSSVTYSYLKRTRILFEDFTVHLQPDKLIVITGESGTGKSTLIKIFSRLIHRQEGKITIDNHDIESFTYASFTSVVGIALQKPYILNDTFLSNLTVGRKISSDDIEQMIDKCFLREVVETLESGIETVIDEDNNQLSVGEMQRLSLARVLLGKPKILWLDEPTSAMDSALETAIIELLLDYKNNNEALIIVNSHQKSILKYADYIVDLN